jgi:hypothetical protein
VKGRTRGRGRGRDRGRDRGRILFLIERQFLWENIEEKISARASEAGAKTRTGAETTGRD